MIARKPLEFKDFDLRSKDGIVLNSESNAILTHYFHNKEKRNYLYQQDAVALISDAISKGHFLGLSTSEILEELEENLEAINFPPKEKVSFKFIDLFAGIGGFRMALQELGGKCVFTSEWDTNAKNTYFQNYGEYPFGDITKPEVKNYIPNNFDVLCAGFPCQPFSKGGFRNGFQDTRGTLFFDLCEIIKKHQPKFLFLENVANMVSHDKGSTYSTILNSLDELGYYFPEESLVLSPDKFGVPILRPRIYIPCVRKDIAKGKVTKIKKFKEEIEKCFVEEINSIDTFLDSELPPNLTDYDERVLMMWDEFYKGIDLKVIGFPIWMEFFKYEESLEDYPVWKSNFIQKNIDLYARNKIFIDVWLAKHENLDWCIKTHRKMEWQAGRDYASIFECLIQFRPSGVRVKRPNKFSTLVAMNHQQIIGKYRRRITIEESKKLQSFPENYQLSKTTAVAMKQLGNSVNVKVIKSIFDLVLKTFA
jgi:DNA (cytosine-5)-methyltransferase 1